MIVGIHNTFPGVTDSISDVYRQILKANNIDYKDLSSGSPDFWEEVKKVDVFIYRWAHTDYHHQHAETIIPVIEKFYGKRCFPNWATCWHYDDKVKQSLMLSAMGFPACRYNVFWDKASAERWIEQNSEYPIVFKLKSGSGSLQVKLVRSGSEASIFVRKMFGRGLSGNYQGILGTFKVFNYKIPKTLKYYGKSLLLYPFSANVAKQWIRQKNYFYVQKYYAGNQYDTRVQITGRRAFAFVRYNRPGDFRASGSNNWSLDHDKIDMEFINIAFEISRTLGFQSMAYDFIYDENKKPVIVEISYCFGDYPEFSNGYWDESLIWHSGRFLPQYFELKDLLLKEDLILPDFIRPSSSYRNVIARE